MLRHISSRPDDRRGQRGGVAGSGGSEFLFVSYVGGGGEGATRFFPGGGGCEQKTSLVRTRSYIIVILEKI